ncbi:TPA: restriction endonuclease subunit S [Streptococcus suis]
MSEVGLKLKKLGELVEIHNNKRIPLSSKERANLSKIYPYYGAQGIVDYVDNYIFDGKNILIAEDGENLKSNNKSICTLATGKYWVNNHAHIVRANNENDTDYLFYKLNSISFLPYITGSAQPKLNKENLLNIPVYVHEKAEQKNISKLLSKIDQKIALNNQINEELEAMAKTLYDYWFVQFDFPDENGKPYKSSGGKMVYNDQLKREIPEGWGVKLLGELSTYVTDKISSNDLNSKNYIGTDNMLSNMKGIEQATYLPNSTLVNSFIPNDILIANIRPYFKKIWISDRTGGCSSDVLCLRANDKEICNYLFYSLARDDFFNYNVTGSKGSKMPRGDKAHIQKYSVLFSEKHALKFSKLVSNFISQKHLIYKQNQELSQLRDWLLPMLMNGQVKVE